MSEGEQHVSAPRAKQKVTSDGEPACSPAATRSRAAYLDFQDALMADGREVKTKRARLEFEIKKRTQSDKQTHSSSALLPRPPDHQVQISAPAVGCSRRGRDNIFLDSPKSVRLISLICNL